MGIYGMIMYGKKMRAMKRRLQEESNPEKKQEIKSKMNSCRLQTLKAVLSESSHQ